MDCNQGLAVYPLSPFCFHTETLPRRRLLSSDNRTVYGRLGLEGKDACVLSLVKTRRESFLLKAAFKAAFLFSQSKVRPSPLTANQSAPRQLAWRRALRTSTKSLIGRPRQFSFFESEVPPG